MLVIGLLVALAAKPLGSLVTLKTEKGRHVIFRQLVFDHAILTQRLGSIPARGGIFEGWYHAPFLVIREAMYAAGSTIAVVRIGKDRCHSVFEETFPSTWDLRLDTPHLLQLFVLNTPKSRSVTVDGLTIWKVDYDKGFNGERHNAQELADGAICRKLANFYRPVWPQPKSAPRAIDYNSYFENQKFDIANRWPGIVGFCRATQEMAISRWPVNLEDTHYVAVIQPKRASPVRIFPLAKDEGNSLAMGPGFLTTSSGISGTAKVRRLSDLGVIGTFPADYVFAEQG